MDFSSMPLLLFCTSGYALKTAVIPHRLLFSVCLTAHRRSDLFLILLRPLHIRVQLAVLKFNPIVEPSSDHPRE
jgi:hypothetical protein